MKTAKYRLICIWLILSIIAYALFQWEERRHHYEIQEKGILAAQTMVQMMEIIQLHRIELGLPIDPETDLNETGMIGEEYTELTTTLGSLEAKRTSLNPQFASLLVWLLHEAGVRPGDTVAIGSSGSFPGIWIASLSACIALEAQPISILSLTASQWGANHPLFTLLEMAQALRKGGIEHAQVHGLSLGGDEDRALEIDPYVRKTLMDQVQALSIPFMMEEPMEENVEKRMQIYKRADPYGNLSCFINIGGALANTGDLLEPHDLIPGLNFPSNTQNPPKNGVIEAMLETEIPVIHVLYLKGIADQYQILWDPVPLPEPNAYSVPPTSPPSLSILLWIVIAYFGCLLASWLFFR